MELNKYIDHTYLKPEGTKENIDKLIEEAKIYNFKTICISPCFIEYSKEKLKGSDVEICTVIGFPSGAHTTETKVFETQDAIKKGADEVDMVMNIGKLKENDIDYVVDEIKKVKKAADNHILKVIIETCLLTDEEKIRAAKAVMDGGADFVKTSTGFSTGGATLEDVKLLKSVVGDKIKIKASGGIRTHEDAVSFIDAGADRIGASKGKDLL